MVIHEHMQSFQIVALLLLGYFWLVEDRKKKKNMLIIIATLATAEVSAGAVAKADQNMLTDIKARLKKNPLVNFK